LIPDCSTRCSISGHIFGDIYIVAKDSTSSEQIAGHLLDEGIYGIYDNPGKLDPEGVGMQYRWLDLRDSYTLT
jgi:hypothetical protein